MKKVVKAGRTTQQRQAKKEKQNEKLQRYKIEKLFRTEDELAIYTDGGYRELKLQEEIIAPKNDLISVRAE